MSKFGELLESNPVDTPTSRLKIAMENGIPSRIGKKEVSRVTNGLGDIFWLIKSPRTNVASINHNKDHQPTTVVVGKCVIHLKPDASSYAKDVEDAIKKLADEFSKLRQGKLT